MLLATTQQLLRNENVGKVDGQKHNLYLSLVFFLFVLFLVLLLPSLFPFALFLLISFFFSALFSCLLYPMLAFRDLN